MVFLKKIMCFLDNTLQHCFIHAYHQVVIVGGIFSLVFPLFYCLWVDEFPSPYSSPWLYLIGTFLGLGLMAFPSLPERLKPYLSWYWFFTLLYALGFFFAYAFLMSNANATAAMLLLCSVFLLVLLMDVSGLLTLLAIGWGLALIAYWLSASGVYFGEEHVELLILMVFVVLAGSLLNYRTSLLQQQRLAGIAAAGGMIAHELRTPLLSIKSGAKAMADLSPFLVEAYYLAKNNNLLAAPLRESRLHGLLDVNERIIKEINYANIIIDMLLIKSGRENALHHCVLEACSMADCVMDALERYPFKNAKQKASVSWQGNFNFWGSKLLMQHVLFNLLKNAFYAIETAQKGEITLWIVSGKTVNTLYFKDTGQGMSAKQQVKLFNHFYTTTFMGTGLGLSFCKLVMNRFGGDIVCEAKEGCYTQFMLTFPFHEQ